MDNYVVRAFFYRTGAVLADAFLWTPAVEPLNVYAARIDKDLEMVPALHERGTGDYMIVVRLGNWTNHEEPLALVPLSRMFVETQNEALALFRQTIADYRINKQSLPGCVAGALGLN